MYGFRVITGFGAGTVFLGVAKLLNDLFPAKFGLMLGVKDRGRFVTAYESRPTFRGDL